MGERADLEEKLRVIARHSGSHTMMEMNLDGWFGTLLQTEAYNRRHPNEPILPVRAERAV